MKVVWLCTFSDEKLRKNLNFPKWSFGNILRRLFHKPITDDYGIWNANARNEFEHFTNEVELHIISPHSGISHLHEFRQNGIYYHIFWKESDILKEFVKRKLNKCDSRSFSSSRKLIKQIINNIQPDIIHVIGIENKFHSMAVLDVSKDIPVIAQLQTLINDERFRLNTQVSKDEYAYNSLIERKIIQRADFIGTQLKHFEKVIRETIKQNAIFVNTALITSEPVSYEESNKEYDFVYFALDIGKTLDLVLEAFALAYRVRPEIKLDIIGGCSLNYKKFVDEYLTKLGIEDAVNLEGKLPTHEDVLRQIRKSRFALLPLKIDLISSTIREAMANGLPVLTTITPDTPKLNDNRECVMLSETGDHEALANNMLKILKDVEYAKKLAHNCRLTSSERHSNKEEAEHWKSVYEACIYYKKNGIDIPQSMTKTYF